MVRCMRRGDVIVMSCCRTQDHTASRMFLSKLSRGSIIASRKAVKWWRHPVWCGQFRDAVRLLGDLVMIW